MGPIYSRCSWVGVFVLGFLFVAVALADAQTAVHDEALTQEVRDLGTSVGALSTTVAISSTAMANSLELARVQATSVAVARSAAVAMAGTDANGVVDGHNVGQLQLGIFAITRELADLLAGITAGLFFGVVGAFFWVWHK